MQILKNLRCIIFSLLIIANSIIVAGAGILPYTKKADGKFYILLGKEYRGSKNVNRPGNYYSDFGGSSDKADKNNKKITAAREGSEETKCVFGDGNFKKSFKYFYSKLGQPILKNSGYPLYPVRVTYIPSKVFNTAKPGKHAEKSKYIWIEASELLNAIQNNNKIPAKYDSKQPYLYPFFISKMKSQDGINFLKSLSSHNIKLSKSNNKKIKLIKKKKYIKNIK